MTLGERIKLRRKELGLTQVQLGEMVHKSSQVISNWERGYTTAMSPEDLQNIAQALNVNITALMGDPTPPAPQKSIEASPAQKEDREHKHLQNLLSDPHLRRILESSGQLSESSLQEVQNFIDFQLGKKKQ